MSEEQTWAGIDQLKQDIFHWTVDSRGSVNNEIVKYINKYQSDTKESLRKTNLALEIFLVRFGYADNFISDQMKQDPSALSFATQKTQIGPDQYASYGALIPSGL